MSHPARLLLCLLLGASLLLQGLAMVASRPQAHFHVGLPAPTMLVLDTGHVDTSPHAHQHTHGVLGTHHHDEATPGVVTVDNADDAGGAFKLPLHGLDAPAPSLAILLPQTAARFSYGPLMAAVFRTRMEAPPAPPPKRQA